MTPKEKAIQLYETFYYLNPVYVPEKDKDIVSKFSAIKCVDEVLFTLNEISEEDNSTYAYHTAIFYNEVKTELKNI